MEFHLPGINSVPSSHQPKFYRSNPHSSIVTNSPKVHMISPTLVTQGRGGAKRVFECDILKFSFDLIVLLSCLFKTAQERTFSNKKIRSSDQNVYFSVMLQ